MKTPLAPLPANWLSRLQLALFWSGLLLFGLANLLLVLVPSINRQAPFEIDDAYTLIHQSPQMELCFLQDCPALDVLRPQLMAETEIESVANLRAREYKSTFLIWHPLYSLVLSGIHGLGFTWEASFNGLLFLGSLLIVLTLAFWLNLMTGPGPAGIAMLFLSIHVFRGAGFSIMLPKTMALWIAMLLWCALLKWPKLSAWTLPLVGLVLIGLHPIGQVYLVVTIMIFALYDALRKGKIRLQNLLPLTLAAIVSVLPLILPAFIQRPELSALTAGQVGQSVPLFDGYVHNAAEAWRIIGIWVAAFWPFSSGPLILVPISIVFGSVWLGIRALPRDKFLRILVWGSVLVGSIFVGFAYYLVSFPAYLFENLWPLLAALLYSLIGASFFSLLTRLVTVLSGNLNLKSGQLQLLGLTVLLLVLSVSLLQFSTFHVRNYSYTLEFRETKDNIYINPAQYDLLLDVSKTTDQVLYTHEVLMHSFFTNGLLERGAVYLPALNGTPEAVTFISENENLVYLVAWNPVEQLRYDFWPWQEEASIVRGGSIVLTENEPLLVTSETRIPILDLRVFVTAETASTLKIQAEQEVFVLDVEDGFSGWISFVDLEQTETSEFSITVLAGQPPLILQGFRTSDDFEYIWPWDEGISFHFDYKLDDTGPVSVTFVSSMLFPEATERVEILDDQGSSILARVERGF